jgi:hypothetical protein
MIYLPVSDAHECCDPSSSDRNACGMCEAEYGDLPCSSSIAMTSFISFSSAPASCSLWCVGREEDQACVLRRRERSFEASSVGGWFG